jgi:hypothetical protein
LGVGWIGKGDEEGGGGEEPQSLDRRGEVPHRGGAQVRGGGGGRGKGEEGLGIGTEERGGEGS